MKPRQGRGRAGFNEIESRQKVVRASFGAAQKAESPRVAGRVQHDLRRGRQAPHGKPFGEPFGEPFSKRQRHPAVIVVAFPQQELSDWRPLPARSTRSLARIERVCVDLAGAAAAAAKQANRPIRAATALAE
ncbi:TPA: hypothetical protein QDB24_004080 [Burkholderia vietnamiensis]|uniref:hypothetical protein n=1 Tax=Burkholderia TaxID=32008 RepID=UPI001113A2C1|nr:MULTISPECIES: hypothetical protein [Burkholderia]MCO1351453.1 hypothetical protein [Burkholderia vietnamiensis]MCO1433343.1 hypothetical protein [Burkholderia vietnamiensis]UQN48848.1 hypothetical protein L0Y95_16085 [Burkholderia vietnamiensis]HDR9046167.1 hypothetical protein [Burkholderia vietnamiensis]HDR9235475.1 hypothetical protein [Burkholderia vietnamiensis]